MEKIIIILLALGVGFLIFFLFKRVILPQRAAANTNLEDKKQIYQTIRQAKADIDRDPQNAEAHYLLGKALLADKREDQAFRAFRSASRLGIDGKKIPEVEFRETMASLYAKFNEEEEALKEYILLIKKHPENPDYYYHAGMLFTSRGRGDRALQFLSKAVALNPREGRYRFELGMAHYHSKKLREAGMEFEAALRINPADDNALLYMGKVMKDTKDFSGALQYLEKAARGQELKLRALVELGSCYMSLKMIDKAIMELERAVNSIEKESEPDSLYARYYLAMCFEKNRDFGKAVAQWDRIYAQKKNFRDVGEKLTQYIEYRETESKK